MCFLCFLSPIFSPQCFDLGLALGPAVETHGTKIGAITFDPCIFLVVWLYLFWKCRFITSADPPKSPKKPNKPGLLMSVWHEALFDFFLVQHLCSLMSPPPCANEPPPSQPFPEVFGHCLPGWRGKPPCRKMHSWLSQFFSLVTMRHQMDFPAEMGLLLSPMCTVWQWSWVAGPPPHPLMTPPSCPIFFQKKQGPNDDADNSMWDTKIRKPKLGPLNISRQAPDFQVWTLTVVQLVFWYLEQGPGRWRFGAHRRPVVGQPG